MFKVIKVLSIGSGWYGKHQYLLSGIATHRTITLKSDVGSEPGALNHPVRQVR